MCDYVSPAIRDAPPVSPAVCAQEELLCITYAPNDLDGEGVVCQTHDSLFVISTSPSHSPRREIGRPTFSVKENVSTCVRAAVKQSV